MCQSVGQPVSQLFSQSVISHKPHILDQLVGSCFLWILFIFIFQFDGSIECLIITIGRYGFPHKFVARFNLSQDESFLQNNWRVVGVSVLKYGTHSQLVVSIFLVFFCIDKLVLGTNLGVGICNFHLVLLLDWYWVLFLWVFLSWTHIFNAS